MKKIAWLVTILAVLTVLLVLKEIEAGTDKSAIAKRIQDSALLPEDKAILNRHLLPR